MASMYRPVRQTRPEYSMGLSKDTLGPAPRRGWDEQTARLIALAEKQGTKGLRYFYQTAPLRLLRFLIETHPMAKMAHSNNAADICDEGTTVILAMKKVTQVNEKTGKEEIVDEVDAEETAELERFLGKYPGGLPGLQRAILFQLEWAGMYCLEAVPAGRGKGIKRGITFDPLSALPYPLEDGGWDWRQSTSGDHASSRGFGNTIQNGMGEVDLDPELTFILALDYSDDNPCGMPWFGGFLQEGLKDFGQERNISDLLKAWAYPHAMFGFPVLETIELAKSNPDLLRRGDDEDDMTVEEYVEQEFGKFLDYLSMLNPDDPIVTPKGTEGKVLESSGGAAMEPILKMRRHRMVMGLDQMPNRVGITEGGTQAYAEEQSRQDARKLAFARFIINKGPEWLCNLHLRLRGKNMTAKVVTVSILPVDQYIEAKARAIDVNTDYILVDRGAEDPEKVAVRRTGHGQHDPARAYTSTASALPPATTDDDDEKEEDDEE